MISDDRNPPKGPLLCRTPCSKRSRGPALLSVVSSVGYLWHYWPYISNKAIWSASVGMPYYLWIGEMPSDLAHTASKECTASPEYDLLVHTNHIGKFIRSKKSFYEEPDGRRPLQCTEISDLCSDVGSGIHSNHHLKILATLAALSSPQNISGIIYADVDTIIAPLHYHNTTTLKSLMRCDADGRIDVLFGEPYPSSEFFWRVGSMYYYVRNTEFGREFMAAWLRSRCGFKDQYSLWCVPLAIIHRSSQARHVDPRGPCELSHVSRRFFFHDLRRRPP